MFRRLFTFRMVDKSLFLQKMQSRRSLVIENEKQDSIKYPYFTFEDHNYRKFMTEILNSLEFRSYDKDEIIIKEMDESLEVIFVEQGLYEIGFEINNRQFYESRFGMSTTIGGF